MSTAQLQQTITKQVLAIQDEDLLEQVLAFLQQKPTQTKSETKVKKSGEKEKKEINIGDPEHPGFAGRARIRHRAGGWISRPVARQHDHRQPPVRVLRGGVPASGGHFRFRTTRRDDLDPDVAAPAQ